MDVSILIIVVMLITVLTGEGIVLVVVVMVVQILSGMVQGGIVRVGGIMLMVAGIMIGELMLSQTLSKGGYYDNRKYVTYRSFWWN